MRSGLSLLLSAGLMLLVFCCSPTARLSRILGGGVAPDISISSEEEPAEATAPSFSPENGFVQQEHPADGRTRVERDGGEPIIMNAVRDSETGEMIATDVITASKVTARFNHVAERLGYVTIMFDVNVPAALMASEFQLRFKPVMRIMEDTVGLDEIRLTGEKYRARQLRGYERYRRFLASIVTDTTDLIMMHQLEVFLSRNYPQTYALRTDSSYVSDEDALSIFGLSRRDAVEHYSHTLRNSINNRRIRNREKMFAKYVKDPFTQTGVRLDTVVRTDGGDFVYTYSHCFRSRPGLKKVFLNVGGSVYMDGGKVCDFPRPEDLTYYISSFSTLVDRTPRYILKIRERTVHDNTIALIDFEVGKAVIDTALGNNAGELRRIGKCVADVFGREVLVLDSLVIEASCSPEGSYGSNARLSAARSQAVKDYLSEQIEEPLQLMLGGGTEAAGNGTDGIGTARGKRSWADTLLKVSSLPENWAKLETLVIHDTIMESQARDRILLLISSEQNPDIREKKLSGMPEYRYLREKIYPQLRCVSFDFHLHRRGMVKDTAHTTEIDSAYMAGVEALASLEYARAVELLRPYRDYNAALAYISSSYNYSALEILDELGERDPQVLYLKAIAWARLGRMRLARECLYRAVSMEPSLRHRANLDPELSDLVETGISM